MSPLAILLILISAATHAGWNLLGKRERPTIAFFIIASLAGALCLIPTLAYYPKMATAFTSRVWLLLIATGFCQALYYTSLANAYRKGDLSIVYPIARSSPALIVTAVAFAIGRGDQVSTQCIVGVMAVMVGCVVLPMRRFRNFRVDNYLNLSSFLALTAAFSTTGYSIIDDEALRLLRNTAPFPNWQIALLYAFFEAAVSTVWLAVFALPFRACKTDLRHLLQNRKTGAVLAGLGIQITYGLVLISLASVANVSYAVGFRQISIPIGALLGVTYLKEPAYIPKFVGVATLFVGLMLIATG